MTVDSRTDIPDARQIRALWVGLLLAPIAFLLNLETAYALVPTACSSRHELPVHVVHLACLLLDALGTPHCPADLECPGRHLAQRGRATRWPGAASWPVPECW